MQLTTVIQKNIRQPAGQIEKLKACLNSGANKDLGAWIMDNLDIKPYQHILEVGYGSGDRLEQVGRKMTIGFLAGLDQSVSMYQQARRRNKSLIAHQMLELHIGTIAQLPYPPHYFHSIFGSNMNYHWQQPRYEFMQLTKMLKSGGRMVMAFQSKRSEGPGMAREAAKKIRTDFELAGLEQIQIDLDPSSGNRFVAALGIKP